MIKVTCRSCGKNVKSSDAWAGRSAKCPNCNSPIVFPATEPSPPEMEAPVDRGSTGAGAERTAPAAKSPGGKIAASAGGAKPANSSPGRKCPVCGQSTPVDVENCVHCGEFVGVPVEMRSATTGGPSLPAEYQDFEVPATSEANLIARLAGLLMVLGPIGGFAYGFSLPRAPNEDHTAVFLVSLVSLVILGGPGVYLAIKGALSGPRAQKNRARGMVQFFGGLGLIAFGAGLTLVVMWIGMQVGAFAIVFVGLIGSGAIMAALGFASLISGRDLKAEMSEMNVFGGG